jgi:hypothetical protein
VGGEPEYLYLAAQTPTPGRIEPVWVRVGGEAEYLAAFSRTPGRIEPVWVRVGGKAEYLAAFSRTLGLVGRPAGVGGLTATRAPLRPRYPRQRTRRRDGATDVTSNPAR